MSAQASFQVAHSRSFCCAHSHVLCLQPVYRVSVKCAACKLLLLLLHEFCFVSVGGGGGGDLDAGLLGPIVSPVNVSRSSTRNGRCFRVKFRT